MENDKLLEGIDAAMERQGLVKGEDEPVVESERVSKTMTDIRLGEHDLNKGASIAMTAVMRQMGLPIIDKHSLKSGFYDVMKKVYGA